MIESKDIHQHRKDEHLSLAIKYWKERKNQTLGLDFSDLRLIPNSLPEIALDEVDLRTPFLGQVFTSPFYIEAITGGTEKTNTINAQLAEVAKSQNLAMAVGSQSIAIKYPELESGFRQVREINPDGFIFANLGANHSLENAKKAIDMIEANALELHINTAQELSMDEGDRTFYWLEHINEISGKLDIPVIVKEVGFGISQDIFKKISQTAVSAINVGGAGGTDFAWIERQRGKNEFNIDHHGFSTVESLIEARLSENQKPLIATGGIQSAEDILKSLMLGASMTSTAGFALSTLMKKGVEGLEATFNQWQSDLQKFYTLQGVRDTAQLQEQDLLYSEKAMNFINQRKNQID